VISYGAILIVSVQLYRAILIFSVPSYGAILIVSVPSYWTILIVSVPSYEAILIVSVPTLKSDLAEHEVWKYEIGCTKGEERSTCILFKFQLYFHFF
jgi:hypothetical protein